MKSTFLFTLVLYSTLAFAQKDTLRITVNDALDMKEDTYNLSNTLLIIYNPKTNDTVSETNFVNSKRNGQCIVYSKGKKIQWQADYKNNQRFGKYTKYYNNGLPERTDIYAADTVVSGTCYNDVGAEIPYYSEPYNYVEEPAIPPGNYVHYMTMAYRFCKCATKAWKNGVVTVRFVVMADGTVNNPVVTDSELPACNADALKMIKGLDKFTPAKLHDVNVNSYYEIPLTFQRM